MAIPANDDGRGPVVIQRVRTTWTKTSRGGVAASLRNAAPIAFRLPSTEGPLLHDVTMDEHSSFVPEHATAGSLPPGSEIELRIDAGRIRLRVSASPWGMPRRDRRPPAVRLEPRTWVRWQINYRFGLDHGWAYRLETWNIGLELATPDTFLGSPDLIVDERSSLR